MKTARALIGCSVLLGAAILSARADDTVAVPTGVPAATPTKPAPTPAAAPAPATPPSINGISSPTVESFPTAAANVPPSDPTDLGTSDPERIAEQTYLMNEQKQKDQSTVDFDQDARRRAYDSDWMMRGYAEQLKKRGLGDSREVSSAVVANPDATTNAATRDEVMMGMPDENKKAPKRRNSSLLNNGDLLIPKKSLVSGSYQPLLKPFDQATSGQVVQNPWDSAASTFDSGLADLETSSGATLLPVPGTIPTNVSRPDTSATGTNAESALLDIPGLTAATQGAIAPNNALTFQDPGESETTSRQHPRTSANNNNFMLANVPLNDVADFFKKQADALRPPTAPNARQALVAPGHQSLPLTPEPLKRPAQQAGMGMRLHVDDPFDILRR